MGRQHFLIKSEPDKYSFADLTRDGKAVWDGVRNFEARNNLRAMRKGDLCLFYHSNEGKEIVGVARVEREAYPDPSSRPGTRGKDAGDGDWSAVDVAPVRALKHPVPLGTLRAHPLLGKMMIFRRPRLSVVPVSKAEYDAVIALT
jgi:predicted RNA-binding protein with PUA-like domain